MKTSYLPVVALAIVAAISPGRVEAAKENAYDTLGKVLMPFVNVLAEHSRSPNRAVSMGLELEATSDAPKELAGTHVQVAFQYPDKLKIHGPLGGEEITVCRRGQKLWAAPGAKVQALLDAASSGRKLPPPDPKFQLQPFQLPIPEKQLVFLPVLFKVQPAGEEEVAGEQCRVIDVQLMPELARSVKGAQGWSARVWARADGRPARIELTGPETHLTVRVTDLQFQPSLPPETWLPAADQDFVKIPTSQYDQLVRAFLGAKAPASK